MARLKGPTKSFTRRAGVLGFVVIAAVAGMLVATALAASSPKRGGAKTKTDIAVLSRHAKQTARAAKAGSVKPPPGAVLAAVFGGTEVYALHNSADEDCVININGSTGGAVCYPSAQVEAKGAVGISRKGEGATGPGSAATLGIVALVPNGVASLRFTDRDGASYDVSVTNNVVAHEDVELASVSYTLPGGGSETTNVAAVADRAPSQPGPAGSSQ